MMSSRVAKFAWLLAALVGVRVGVCVALWNQGFTHVSDDDFARIVIAQLFVVKPSIDPSGTSWLPFPFWILGGAFVIGGRSLLVAKIVAVLQSTASWAVLLHALKRTQVSLWPSVIAAIVAMCTPWNLWLSATPVPEGFLAPLLAAAMLLSATPNALAATLLVICTLSRYESWPVAVAVAAMWFAKGAAARNRDWLLLAGSCVSGIVLWALWNRFAHGDAFHFFARVSRYRQSLHLPGSALWDRLTTYPRALISACGPAGWVALGVIPLLQLDERKKWATPLLLSLVQLLALMAGELADGAPTHHPERAVLSVAVITLLAGITGLRLLLERLIILFRKDAATEPYAGAVAILLGVFLCYEVAGDTKEFPGREGSSNRVPQLVRGKALAPDARYRVRPCSYEHFALIAASGRPEQFELDPPPERTEPTPDCPSLEVIRASE